MPDDLLWVARPSVRTLIPGLLLYGAFASVGCSLSGPLSQWMINLSAAFVPWTDVTVRIPYHGLQILTALPFLNQLLLMLVFLTTRYAITSDRFLYERGILMRKYDQIRLERVRDFRIFRPLAARLTGTGFIMMISRDETLPQILVGPFPDPNAIEKVIRTQVIARQKESGYREFEAT